MVDLICLGIDKKGRERKNLGIFIWYDINNVGVIVRYCSYDKYGRGNFV